MLVVKLIFKTINFFTKIHTYWARKYDKLRIKETCISFENPIHINAQKSFVTHKTKLGKNVNFNGMKMYGGGNITIGDNFHSGTDCSIITQIHNYNGNAIPYDNTYIFQEVIIEDNVWIGQGVMILGGVTIGEGAIIQAGSVVVSSISKFVIAGGHPAKAFKTRDVTKYLKLKEVGKFH